MQRLNQDTLVAIVLLVFCGVCFWASFDIRQPDYGVLLPSTWPRVILGVLSLLSFTYLVQSIRRDRTATSTTPETHLTSVWDWLRYWRNPLYCFGLFLAYLLMLPILGMLLAPPPITDARPSGNLVSRWDVECVHFWIGRDAT